MRLKDRAKERLRRALGVDLLAQELTEVQGRVAVLEAEMWNRPHLSDDHGLTAGSGEDTRFAFDASWRRRSSETYLDFEDVFRGSRALVRQRLSGYLALFPARATVLDLGCGRGEMLELLTESGHSVVGVDTDSGMVAQCRAAGHDVVEQDALGYLRQAAPGSFDVVFSAQFVEHLPPPDLPALLAESLRVLRPGGLLVAETVNPHCLSALRTFWVDLTHEKPLWPEVVLFLARHVGFATGEIRFPLGRGDFEWDRRHTGEYALIAHRTA